MTTDKTADARSASQPAAQRDGPRVPRAKLWIFFGLFFIVAATMYAGTMYRIQNYGYTGIGQDELAHPDDAEKGATPQN